MTQAPGPLGLLTSELALDRAAPGNQLLLFFLSAPDGGLPSLVLFECDRPPCIGVDTTRCPSGDIPRTTGGCADTLRPRELWLFGSGGACWGCSRFGCSFALDGGRSREGLLSSRLAPVGVACVAVTAGMRDGVPCFVSTVGGVGGGGGGEEVGMVGAL
jgi:hypothetical protein